MTINPIVDRHLNEALTELRAQRLDLDTAIAEVEATLSRLRGEEAPPVPKPGSEEVSDAPAGGTDVAASGRTEIAPSMRDAILEVMDLLGEATTAHVVGALEGKWDWQASSIRSQMSKMSKDGILGNPRRGVYNMDPSSTPPKMSEAPSDELEASDELAPSTAKEGGDELDDAAPHQVDRSTGQSSAGQPDNRAPIEG